MSSRSIYGSGTSNVQSSTSERGLFQDDSRRTSVDINTAVTAAGLLGDRIQFSPTMPVIRPDGTILRRGDLWIDTTFDIIRLYNGSQYITISDGTGSGGGVDTNTTYTLERDGDNIVLVGSDGSRDPVMAASAGGGTAVRCITDADSLVTDELRYDGSGQLYQEYYGQLLEINSIDHTITELQGPIEITGIGLDLNKGSLDLNEFPRGLHIVTGA